MSGDISLDKKTEEMEVGEEPGLLRNLEEKIGQLLARYHELKKERDHFAAALDMEKEKVIRLEKRMKLLSQDREKVKTRIDQLLHRFKSMDT